MIDSFEEFTRDLEENKQGSPSNRADNYKLQNGDNKIVLLTNPVGFSELFNVGIAYENCGYGQYARRYYRAYVLDMRDGKVKIVKFNYTVAKALNDVRISPRTAFNEVPCPYIMNLRTENAGKKEVKTSVLAEDDYVLTQSEKDELASYDSVRDIIERMKMAQKKKVENDPGFKEKIDRVIESEEQKIIDRRKKKSADSAIGNQDLPVIEYPEDEGEIPF